MKFFSIISLVASASAISVNCRGSAVCGTDQGAKNAVQTVHDQVAKLIDDGGGDRHFATNEQIACAQGSSTSFCTFYSNGASGTAKEAVEQLQTLIDHGCRRCGSIPVVPSHQAIDGVITVNAKADACCKGDCHC